jgi:small subunit ribosomal protein S3
MTHIVHPYAHRLGIIRDWKSRWFAKTPKEFRQNVMVDSAIRRYLRKRLRGNYVTSVEIERDEKHIRILIKTSRPGLVIGRGGEGSQKLTKEIEEVVRKVPPAKGGSVSGGKLSVRLDIEEVRSPESQAPVVAYMVAEGLEKRQPFRRVLKQTVEKVMANRDVEGVRIAIAGRLGGAEMSRQEEIKKGRVPLQTLRADIDFAREIAYLPYGVIGVKVWIYRGDVFTADKRRNDAEGRRISSANVRVKSA